MKKLFASILIGILLVGCASRDSISKYNLKKNEIEFLNELGVEAEIYNLDLKNLDETNSMEIFIDKYENGKFVETEFIFDTKEFAKADKEKFTWTRMKELEDQNEIWKFTISSNDISAINSKNVEIDKSLVNRAIFEIIDSRAIKKDNEVHLSGLVCYKDSKTGYRTSVEKNEVEDYIKDFDITYILGIRVK